MIQSTYKLKLNERIRAKCSRHPPLQPREGRHWRMVYVRITFGLPVIRQESWFSSATSMSVLAIMNSPTTDYVK
jgi:hypothetical protein